MSLFPEPPRGLLDGPLHRYAVKVYYEDTDASGIVFYANYLRWFERARSDILELLGVDQRASIDAGDGFYVVSELAIRYLSPARLGEDVLIETRCEDAKIASLRMVQSAWRGDTKLSEARVKVGFIGPDGRPRRQPHAWRQAFAALITEPER